MRPANFLFRSIHTAYGNGIRRVSKRKKKNRLNHRRCTLPRYCDYYTNQSLRNVSKIDKKQTLDLKSIWPDWRMI